jgi:CAAX protease family protein
MIHDETNAPAASPDASQSHETPQGNPGNQGATPSAPYATIPGPRDNPGTEAVPVSAPHSADPALLSRPGAFIPEDLRAPWGWSDVLLFVGFGFAAIVVISMLAARIAIGSFGVPLRDLEPASTSAAKSTLAILGQAVWSGLVLAYFFALVSVRTAAPFWRTMGWRGLRFWGLPPGASAARCLGGGAALAVIVSFMGRFLGQPNQLPIEQMFRSRSAVLLLMAFGLLVAPLVEETMFRGFLYPVIARRFGVGAGVIVTGAAFGAMHAQQLWGGWGQIGLLILVGIVLTWVRARTGTVAASYCMHLGYNTLLFLGFYLGTGGLRHIPGG